ncbi:lauroyl-Kdo(2)-lipid IV(A) myristoyltransferase [Alginatibacterium sediminis]|uniref:Lipid A biosynthesis acyltransferase n=1 Tax=Alginatibacterium sediminis TaxID=2164068 RepID=A0A420EIA6_9ALTE|nr:lauroyl-Kdo(2)-lipid IV(A) myristoyltransferase [Alginatibacterium sediminis]RKF20408.1 lauroyl-Kdo(2)-lipid IV(A) myristoyltransferase [Alginatibacterium sediminis]
MSQFNAYKVQFSWSFLHPRYWLQWLGALLMVLLCLIPVKVRDWLAVRFARFMFKRKVLKKRLNIADINLQLCFPQWDSEKRQQVLLENLEAFAQVMFAYGELSVRSRKYIQERIIVDGQEHIDAILESGDNFIVLLPHTYPVDYAGLYFSAQGRPMSTMFKEMRAPLIDYLMARHRTRFGGALLERKAGLKALMKTIRAGMGCIYLPDEDLGPKHSVFVPFFGNNKATIPVLGKMAKICDARVLPIFATYDSEQHKIKLIAHPPLTGYPSGDAIVDSTLMNKEVEKLVRRAPEQYMWTLSLMKSIEGQKELRY